MRYKTKRVSEFHSHCCRNLYVCIFNVISCIYNVILCIYIQSLSPFRRVCFERAEQTCGLELSVTGALGFRTIYQVKSSFCSDVSGEFWDVY